MKRKIFVLLIIALLVSCGGKPKGVLSEKEMVAVITDLNLAEGTLSVAGISWTNKQEKEAYYNSVFEKHNITLAQLDTSFVWYARTPAKLEDIYEKINANLTKMQSELENAETK